MAIRFILCIADKDISSHAVGGHSDWLQMRKNEKKDKKKLIKGKLSNVIKREKEAETEGDKERKKRKERHKGDISCIP